jgi:hypothetical protein
LYYAATAAPWDSLKITGQDDLRWYAASGFAHRGFCGTCGSALFWKPNDHPHVAILAGSLDETTTLKASCHIFTEQRPGYYGIEDGLPQFQRDHPGLPVDAG